MEETENFYEIPGSVLREKNKKISDMEYQLRLLTSKSLMEDLADEEHIRWSHWMKHLFSKCIMNSDGTATIPAWAVERWSHQIETDYKDLTESEKESDREEVRKGVYKPLQKNGII